MDGDGQLAGRLHGHADLVDRQDRIRRDDRAGAEVDPFSGEVRTESALLALQPLDERLQGPAGAVASGGDPRRLVVEVRGDMVLKELPQVFDDELRRTGVAVLAEPLVDPQDVDELVRQV